MKALLFILMIIPATAHSAEISYLGMYNAFLIEGTINKFDSIKFKKAIRDRKGETLNVFLRSPGGNVLEAIKIGNIIRDLHLQTSAPDASPSQRLKKSNEGLSCTHPKVQKENCTCDSACFLLFAAGVNRFGNVLGVHRVYSPHSILKQTSIDEALEGEKLADRIISDYLKKMNVPPKYFSIMKSIPSEKILYLDDKQINSDFNGYIPGYDEWIKARCGEWKSLYNDRSKKLSQSDEERITKSINCSHDAREKIVKEKFKLFVAKEKK